MIMKRQIIYFLLFTTIRVLSQQIYCDNKNVTDAYKLAVNTVDINTRRGILAAGGDYGGEWTRDISINSWNGVSLIRPQIAEQSLWSVTSNKDSIGNQYWDKIIWTIAALNFYEVTGDSLFLKHAYRCSFNTMKSLEKYSFDKAYGLFKGPSVFNDGIAGYPEPIWEPDNFSSSVLDYENSIKIKCLSTNCVYYGAYKSLAKMNEILKINDGSAEVLIQKAKSLKNNILKNFYRANEDKFYYLIDQNGKPDSSQEALGNSFAVIFGIIEGKNAHKLVENAEVSKHGITSIYPDFPRFSGNMPGRHNNIIWPMVNGFFAKAAIISNNFQVFNNELINLIHLALDEDKGNYDFREIYNPYTGKPDGGYQDWGREKKDFHWESCRLQTWSATAYLNMVYFGLAGIRIDGQKITFSPFLPDEISYLEINDIIYRGVKLDIVITGKGNHIKRFLLNGTEKTDYNIKSPLKISNRIVIEVE